MSNSAAIIGTPTNSTVTEDTNLQTLIAAGSISISDANPGQAAFRTTVTAAAGDLGTLAIAANGSYVYSVADSKVQYLGAGDTKVDTFTVTSLDGTQKQVSFTIYGVNDAAVIGAPSVADVVEDATHPTLKAIGTISISDADQGQAAFKTTVISAAGNLGNLVLQSSGSYTYSVADSAVQYLGAGQVKTDVFTVTALDGTTKQISFNIHGTNDAAVIGTPTQHDVYEDASQPTLSASGSISISDADQGQAAFKTTVTSAPGTLGNLVLAANGTYTYSVADSAVQYLGAGETKVDTFTVTSLDGTTKQVSFTIHGVNDAAVIGTPTVSDVTEDASHPLLFAFGTISIFDPDQGQSAFRPAILSGAGNLGVLILDKEGCYVYAVADSAVQYLGQGDTKIDTFTVVSVDGTQKQVSFTIHGVNDAAVIGTPTVSDVTEDANPTTLTASGTISISDVDQNQSTFKTAVTAAAGTLGALSIATNGAYTYSVDDSKVQYLGAGQTKTETFTVTAFDGTQKQVSFTIHGVNDAAVIGTPTVHDVFSDPSKTTLTATGSISISDADQGQAAFTTAVASATGNSGHLTLAADGSYTYSVAESVAAQLGAGSSKVDTFTVTSLDGTTKQVSFTIHGAPANTPAAIGDPTNASVTEDVGGATLSATGTIPISDPDVGQAAFQTTVAPGAGNLGTLSLQSNGSYTYSVLDSAVQYLGAGDTKVDSFTVTSVDGTSKLVSFTIYGANDAAAIGDPLVHDVTEDTNVQPSGNLVASGQLSVVDPDQNQSSFQPGTITGAGNLGTLSLQSNGSYTYSVLDSAVQYLGAGDTKVDSFTVTSVDGTSKLVSFTIHGANDAAIIGDPLVHDVTEDTNVQPSGNLVASGQLSVVDPDQNQSSFQPGTITGAGNLGTLTLAADGTYTYSVANAATQSLAAGDTHIDTFTVHSADGTAKVISFDVHGINDPAVIGDPPSHDVTEDATTPTLSVSGQLTVPDADHDQSAFATNVVSTPGNLGQLTISADGHYTYSVDNASVQSLAAGEVRNETFTVASVDGTQKPITFTIHGTQDAPALAVATASGTDDAAIPLSIAAHLVDDSGTLGPIVITGIPSGYTLNHGTYFDGDGHWEVPSDAATLSTLALIPGADAHQDTLVLNVSVASIENGQQAVTSANMTVNVGAGQGDASARAVDGYVAGAFVFADANGNGTYDTGEASAITNADGSFTLHNPHGTLIMSGGTDISTGLAFAGTLKAPEGSTVVTPLTTLVTSVVAAAAANNVVVSAADAATQVASAFGIDPTKIDITTFDPVPAAVGGNADATAVLAAAVQVQSTIVQMSAVGASSTAVVDAIAQTISTAGTVDLTSSNTITAIATNSHVDADAIATVTAVVQAANTSIQTAQDVTTIAQAAQVAQGDAAASLAAITNFADPSQTSTVTTTYVDNLSTQVQAAVVASPAGPILGTSGNDVLTGTAAIDTIDGLEGNDQISGGDGADLLFGGAGNDRIAGNAGDDHIDGGAGFDRALYTDATGGVAINMAAGTASGAGVGSDTLVNVEAIVGSAFDDTYNATGFTGISGIPGSPIGYNEFEGGGGNDTVIGTVNAEGAFLTRVSYVSATSGVTVDLAAGTADGDASVGHDTFLGGIQSVWGSSHDDVLRGSNNGFGTAEVFAGFAGNDTIDGRGGFDRVDYNQDPTTTSGITVHLAAGTVTGDASVGTDTLLSIEAVRGTNFADTYDATGFSGTSVNAGSFGTFNEFTGGGGNDTIIGNGNTRLSFNNATSGVTVDLQTGATPGTGTATGDASVGTDTFSGVNAVQGSMFDDVIYGSNNTAVTETFTGNGGNDYIDGRGGFDIASYNNIYLSTGSITVNMAAGIVTGDSSIGTDTLRSIEGIQGTVNADTYDATGYGAAGALNIGNNGTFNQFEGLGGNDVIIGNGNTRAIYANAAAAVTVDLSLGTAHGTAAGDVAAIGTDTLSGVFSVTGSAFGDTLIGSAGSDMFVGNGGNDQINGGAGGDIAIYSGAKGQYTISTDGAGHATVTDNVTGRDGTDTLTNVEALQFSNGTVLITSGTAANPVDLSDGRLYFNAQANPFTTATGSADDYVKINQGLSGHLIDLGAGTNDTVMLGVTGGYNLNLANVEHLVGTSGGDFVGFISNVNGLTIDMGGGTDGVNLANGSNSVSVTNVENLNGSDFAAGSVSNDTLTLLNDVSGLSVNLANGVNTLNLAAGANALTNIFNVDNVNGTASDDTLSVASGLYSPNNDLSIDLGAGNDTLTVGTQFGSFALHNVEHLAITAVNAFYTLTNDQNGLAIDFGGGNSGLQIAAGSNTLALTGLQNIGTGDYVGGSAVSDDTLTLLNDVTGVTVNLQQGDNTLNLAAGTNSITAFNVQHINGTASDDVLTMLNDAGGDTIDLGAGNDTLNLTGFTGGVTVANVEHVNGSTQSDFITDATVIGTTTITGGGGADFITLGAATNIVRYTDASESSVGTGLDTVTNFDATHDQILLDGVIGAAGAVHFMASGVLDGSAGAPKAEAILVDVGGQNQLQIDVNGDGIIGGNDIVVVMNGLAGALTDANFQVISENHAPTDIAISNASVAENSPAGTVVGTLSDSDPDAGDTATFTLTDDAGGLFAIANGNLVTTAPLDYEQAISHQVTVQVADSGGATFSKTLQIGVVNVNEAPTDIVLSNAAVQENAPAGTVVGTLSAIDPDAGDTASFALTNDAGGLFAIVNGQIVTTAPLDYEQAQSHQVTVRATDAGGLSFDKTLAIATINVNEAPTAVLLSNSSVAENSAAGTVVGSLSAIDPDAGDTATFALTNDAGGLFAVVNGNLVTTAPLDYEQAQSHQVTVRATDSGGLFHDTTFTIATTNVNEAPTDILLSNAVIPQNTAVGTVVGALSDVDPDAGDTATFTLVNDAGGQFAVDVHGNLVVAGPLTAGAEQVVVRATDSGGLTFDKSIAITVNPGALVVGTAGPDTLVGTAGEDTIQGLAGNDRLQGLAGNDVLDGGPGLDRAVYTDATSGITVNMAGGTVTGGSGSDTLLNIEGVVGSDFADTYDSTGFAGDTGIAGTNVGFNEFEGRGGNDTIISAVNALGALLTRISYISATAAVTVDLSLGTAHGTAAGDLAGIGTDTLVGHGFAGVVGSSYDDTLIGSNNLSGTVEIFAGMAGNDLINGGGGFDRADYAQDPTTASGITVNMAAGTVSGDSTIGNDTLRSVESVRGTNLADTYVATGFSGTSTNAGSNGTFNEFIGMGGNDQITGNGNTRLSYTNATGGVTVDIAAGSASGDASTGNDTFSGVNAIQGSMFDDILRGSNNTSSTETFYGGAGNDFIDGRGGFDLVTYNNAYFSTGAVTVDMGAGTATGDASVGNDTLRSIEAIQGTAFADHYDATTFGTGTALNIGNNGTFNQFEGLGGNDTVVGNGNTRMLYSSATGGVTIHMAAGTADGDASVGHDTFTAVNSATGSQFADTYDATGFVGGVGAFGFGNFNLFEGLGGNDTITGNGNTRIAYSQAAAGVTVDLSLGSAHSTGANDAANVGTDTITGGVNSVQGSNFNDTLTGGAGNELFFGGGGADTISGGGGNDQISGQAGNDAIDGGAGTDMAIYTGPSSAYTVTTLAGGQIQVADSTQTRDGTDVLTNVEVLQFSDLTTLLSSGSAANPIDLSTMGLGAGGTAIHGTAGDDYLMVGGSAFGHPIDLGGGNDTVALALSTAVTLTLANVENVVGSSGNDFIGLANNANGLSIDGGAGNDVVGLANGVNSITVQNVENINGNDFTGSSDDTLTLQNDVTGVTVNLANGNNTLNLAAGANSLVDIFNVQHVNGTSSDDVLTVTDTIGTLDNNPTIDLGAGNNTLNIGSQFESMTLLNTQHLNGSSLDNFFTLKNDVSGLAVDLGAGNDTLNLANGTNSVSLFNVENLDGSDFTGGISPSDDTVTLLNDVSGLTVNLADGHNTLNLAAGVNSLDSLFNIAQLNGTASDDTLTVTQQSFGTVFDMGAGNDTINFQSAAGGVTVVNAEAVNGSTGNDFITIGTGATATTVTGGAGADTITVGSSAVNFNFNAVGDSQTGNGDTVVNFDASSDTFTFTNMTGPNGFTGPVHFVGTAGFDGTAGALQSEARVDNSGGNATLQIDVNGDGVMDSNDVEIHLTNYVGTLHDSNFILA
jgi:VCBS repeat-containing protein